MAVPGRIGQRKVEQGGEPLVDVEGAFPEDGERAARAAELQHQRFLAQALEPLARARQRPGIARDLQAERHRLRMLQRSARHGRGPAVASGERHVGGDRAIEVRDQRVDAGAQLQHRGGIDHVLLGRTEMDVAGGVRILLGDVGRQGFDQRREDIAGARRRRGDRRDIEALDLGGRRDRLDRLVRDDADGGLRAGERRLEVQHALQARAVVDDGPHRGARKHRHQQGRGRKRFGHGNREKVLRADTLSACSGKVATGSRLRCRMRRHRFVMEFALPPGGRRL